MENMNNLPARPDWDEYFMEIAEVVRKRSTCLRRKVGAIIVKDSRILATGYNGAPAGVPHCGEVGCLRAQLNVPSGERHELCRVSTLNRMLSFRLLTWAFLSLEVLFTALTSLAFFAQRC